jgi:POT family proton-dependent oligopeptide transporter
MNTNQTTVAVPTGHPRGLYTLFFTEMWERFSYYGMRALLVLFMVDAVQKGGMGMDDKSATAIYGLYTAAVYLMSLPGGWLADRIWGAQRAVWYGGIIIALGHFTLALPLTQTFYLGLIFVVIGSGILKPNMSSLVGELYPEGGSRRDAGFTIFYMGVNLGAFIGPIVCGWLATRMGWHWGFGAAGVGMVFGLIQFKLSRRLLANVGMERGNPRPLHSVERFGLIGSIIAAIVVIVLGMTGMVTLNPAAIATVMAYVILVIAVLYFAAVFLFCGLDKVEKERVGVILVLFVASALFWAGFEQAGSSFNLFAKRHTVRTTGFDFATLRTNDISDFPTLLEKLAQQTDPVSRFLGARLTNVAATSTPMEVARGLNGVIAGPLIFQADRFAGVDISPSTRALLDRQDALSRVGKGLNEDDLTRVNRWLLEDAYPTEISSSHTRPAGFVVPAAWFQALGPVFIIIFAPLFAWLWVWLARRNLDPSIPVKFALGLLFLALGFFVMAGAAQIVAGGNKALPTWLVTTYLVHTFGELCLSPVGLSSVTKLAPRKLVGQMMGVWFLATSFGNLLAGLLAGEFKADATDGWPALYLKITILPLLAGGLLIVCAKPIKRWLVGVK